MSLEAPLKAPKKGPTKALLPAVIAVGIVIGIALSYLVPLPYGIGPLAYFADQFRTILILDMIFSTVSIALLVTLVGVYIRIFSETRARFALGILVVMLTLLFQALFRYPLILSFVGRISFEFGPFLSSADILSIAAYSIFLYLSLE